MRQGARRARSLAGLALLWLLGAAVCAAQDLQPIPKLAARVTDLTGTLTAEQQNALEQKLSAFEAAKGAQVAVLIVPTTQPEEISQYSIRVVEQWKLGRGSVNGRRVDDGALLIIAKNDHRVRIEVGYGLEGVLTDAMSNRIISETIAPAFREGNFYGGIEGGLEQMMKLIEGESLPPPEHEWQRGARHGGGGAPLLPALVFAVLVGSVVLRAIFGRTLGSAFTGVGAGALVYLAGYALALAGLAAVAAFFITLLTGFAGTGSGWSSGRRGGFGGGWGGIGGGGFGGGGFGGGGFSGGGGGFGGGGASGSW